MQHLKIKFLCYPGQSLGALGRGTHLVLHSEQFGAKSRRFFTRFRMMWGAMTLSVLLLCLPAISLGSERQELRNTRHCEVILFNPKFKLSVYSTIGLNACPETSWEKMTVSRVKQETGVFFVYLSGPRYLVIDDFENPLVAKSASRLLGGIQMREAAVLHPNLMDIIHGAEPYREHVVERRTTWIYQAGHPIYALINPKGQVFVMQSYSVEISPLTQAGLADLGKQLVLPKGWRFRTTVLAKEMHLTTVDNKSVVILDSLLNSYQLAKNDLLQPIKSS